MDIKTMNILKGILLLTLVKLSCCVYEEQPQAKEQQYYKESVYKKPPPRIISHKQAQNHDGGFKFAYTAENGQAHSEVIAPDGSRNGGYTYIDANGKTISVKYTAGKEGFRILEGEHIPRQAGPSAATDYQQQQQQQQQQQYQQQPAYHQPILQQQQQYQPRQLQPHYAREYTAPPPEPRYERPQFTPQYPQQRPHVQQPRSYPTANEGSPSNSVEEEKEPEYNDEPGKAYSFGAGYSFQFQG